MKTFIGLDLGTSNIKGVLIDEQGTVIAQEKIATELLRLGDGKVEFSSQRSYELLLTVIKNLTAKVSSGSIVNAISLSGATGNTVLLDNDGTPLCNAFSWMDDRSASDESLNPPPNMTPDEVHAITGWPWFKGFPLVHLNWLKNNRNDIYAKAPKVCMNITYLYHRLCGAYAVDYSTATTFYLQNQVTRKWHKPYLDWLGLNESQLPALLPSGSVIGQINRNIATETGLSPETKVVLGSFDHPSAARGCGVLKEGDLLLSCGTSWVGFYPVNDRDKSIKNKLLSDPFLSPQGPWGSMFSIPRIGDEVQKFVDTKFSSEKSAADRFIKFNNDPESKNLMTKISMSVKDKIDNLSKAGFTADRIFMVGGPSESPVWPGILRRITGLIIETPAIGSYAGALGAAFMAQEHVN
jgi:sugar (pentulose or hexulose) kinase